jgi:transcriptional regulator with XRE-family HTH domain
MEGSTPAPLGPRAHQRARYALPEDPGGISHWGLKGFLSGDRRGRSTPETGRRAAWLWPRPRARSGHRFTTLGSVINFAAMGTIVSVQSWIARTALGWDVSDLARAAEVSRNTVVRFERGEALKPDTVDMIQSALERAGVIFISAKQGGPGARLRSSRKAQLGESSRRRPVTRQGESVTESEAISELRRQVDELRKRLDRWPISMATKGRKSTGSCADFSDVWLFCNHLTSEMAY